MEVTNEISTQEDMEKKGEAKHWVVIGSIIILVVIAFIISYLYFRDQNMKKHYKEVFYPMTTINGIPCGESSYQQIENQLLSTYDDYALIIKDYNGQEVGRITADDLGVYTTLDVLPGNILQSQNTDDWKNQKSKNQNYQINCTMNYDPQKLKEFMDSWDLLDYSKMIQPRNAYIGDYDPELNIFPIIPEDLGSKVDADKVRWIIKKAVEEGCREVSLTDCYIGVSITKENPKLVEKANSLNAFLKAEVVYDWNGNEVVVDADLLSQWITEKDNTISFDKEKVAAFVTNCAETYDTYGKDRKFTTVQGTELTLKCESYGWKTDVEAETEVLFELICQGKNEVREPIYAVESWSKGEQDIGSSYVEIDLTNQKLYVIMEGNVDLESDIVSGCIKRRNRTPEGIYGVTYKTKNRVLRGPTWNTFVKYWMPFNGNIGMHDASWRKEFGGDIYINSGSHGCINLPTENAKKVYEYVSTGFPVVCYYYE